MFSRVGGRVRATNEDSVYDLKIRPTAGLRCVIYCVVAATVIVAVVPSLYSILWSLMGTQTLGVLAARPTSRWFKEILTDSDWLESLSYSAVLAVCASALGAFILVLHFYFVRYARPLLDRVAYLMVVALALVPVVVYALALRAASGPLNLGEWVLLLLGQLVMVLPVQFFMLESAQELAPDELLFAGSTLGATHMRNVAFVYWPAIRNSALTAFVLGAFIAFDELVLATFLVNSRLVTAPRRLWDQINSRMDPSPAVVSCLLGALFLICVATPWVWRRLQRIGKGAAS